MLYRVAVTTGDKKGAGTDAKARTAAVPVMSFHLDLHSMHGIEMQMTVLH